MPSLYQATSHFSAKVSSCSTHPARDSRRFNWFAVAMWVIGYWPSCLFDRETHPVVPYNGSSIYEMKCKRTKIKCSVWGTTVFLSLIEGLINPAMVQYHGMYVTPVLLIQVFFKCHEYWHRFYVFFRKAFLTMSHTFGRFCAFPFIFFIFISAWGKWTPLYLPCNGDNCLHNAENAVCKNICHEPCSRRTNSLQFRFINKARTH